jgi:serine/threonine protein kinase
LVETDIDLEDIKIKVADFGFSSFATAGSSGAVKLARTEPWEAPEWHHRYTTLENAKKMDIYGFGLLLLWALFRDRPIPQLVEPSLTLEEALFSTETRTTARVQALKKKDDSVLKCALQLLRETKDVDDQDRIRLKEAFTLTLSSKPANRAQSMRELVELLGLPEGQDVKYVAGLFRIIPCTH